MTRAAPPLAQLLRLTLAEWRHHPARHAMALLAVALGVALAFSVHVINRSALAEFSAAVRTTQGEPDLVVRARDGLLPDALYGALAVDDAVLHASPALEVDTYARPAAERRGADGDVERVALRVLGVDALQVAPLAPRLLPRVADGEDRLAFLDPQAVFLNAAARRALAVGDGDALSLLADGRWQSWRVAGSVPADGPPLAVMDIAAAQARFDRDGSLSRIDLRLVPGADAQRLAASLPAAARAVAPEAAEQRVSQLSRAYRVNLTVLALVALFVGAFLVYSVVALSVAQRTPGLALMGVLGLPAASRRRWIVAECALVGAAGSAVGLAGGAALAAAALRWLAGDLGGGYFPGVTPRLEIDAASTIGFGALGVASAVVGGWWPAKQAERLQPALALKGLGSSATAPSRRATPIALALLVGGAALAFVPPIAGLPLAAYASVAALLFGGVALVPAVVQALPSLGPEARRLGALPLLALRRAHHQRHVASAAVAGVVASLALSAALTVMVSSFRAGVSAWLDDVLPADLYARTASSSTAADQAWLPRAVVDAAAQVPGVARLQAARVRALSLDPALPTVALVTRPLADPAAELPMVGAVAPAQPGTVGAFVSEAVVALHGARVGHALRLPLASADGSSTALTVHVRGVWRDYARQFGTIAIAESGYRAHTGDDRINELAIWLAPGAEVAAVQDALRRLAGDGAPLAFASAGELRAVSLRIFDRSFAVTRYLQAVAIAIGLVGVAASLSAQVIARRKEFGLLSHLGLTRRQVLALVAGESALWLAAGVAVGLALGAAIATVLVEVVNPQSFHWTMAIVWPLDRLALLAAAVLAAGVLTAAASARHAVSRAAVLSVKEDW